MPYFSNFPKINYFDKTTRNIILKAAIVKDVFNKVDAFYPYIIKEGERPDIIAFNEYDDENLDWVVYFSNDIVDPYYDWPLDSDQFNDYLKKKYGLDPYSLQGAPSHYEYTGVAGESEDQIKSVDYIMTVDSYNYGMLNGYPGRDYLGVNSPYYLGPGDNFPYQALAGWSLVSIYDKEDKWNQAKRSIKLISKYYINQIKEEIQTVFNK